MESKGEHQLPISRKTRKDIWYADLCRCNSVKRNKKGHKGRKEGHRREKREKLKVTVIKDAETIYDCDKIYENSILNSVVEMQTEQDTRERKYKEQQSKDNDTDIGDQTDKTEVTRTHMEDETQEIKPSKTYYYKTSEQGVKMIYTEEEITASEVSEELLSTIRPYDITRMEQQLDKNNMSTRDRKEEKDQRDT